MLLSDALFSLSLYYVKKALKQSKLQQFFVCHILYHTSLIFHFESIDRATSQNIFSPQLATFLSYVCLDVFVSWPGCMRKMVFFSAIELID